MKSVFGIRARDILLEKACCGPAPSDERCALVLETARRIALDVLINRQGDEVLQHIADAVRNLAHAKYAAIGIAKPDGCGLSRIVTTGIDERSAAAVGGCPVGKGVLGLLLKQTEPLRVTSIEEHPAFDGFPPHHPRMKSFLGVPIRRGDAVIGSLYLADRIDEPGFTDEDEALVAFVGDYAAVAIHYQEMLARQEALVKGLFAAQEEERRSVAFDLHDGLTQYVMAAHANLQSYTAAEAEGRSGDEELRRATSYLAHAATESRRMVSGLRSLALDDLGIVGALEELIREEKAEACWEKVMLGQNLNRRRFDPTIETAAFRVLQEAVTNIRKHASAKRVSIHLNCESAGEDESLVLEVTDDGRGFDQNRAMPDHTHVGLPGMAERVRLLGGTFELRSAPGQGTAINAAIPLKLRAKQES